MTKEEVLNKIETEEKWLSDAGYTPYNADIAFWSIKQAVKNMALEPCEDAVSRQSVKEGMIKYGFRSSDMTVTEFVEDVLQLATTRKKGKWIIDDFEELNHITKVWRCHCSSCNKDPMNFVYGSESWWTYKHKLPHICPNCGAEMESEDGSN